MFALYGLGRGSLKTIKKIGRKTKKIAKKTGRAIVKTIPHPTKPGVKVTLIRPEIPSDKVKTAIPLIKVVSKKKLSPKSLKKAAGKAAKKTLKKAAHHIALKKGSHFIPNAKKSIHDLVQKKIEEVAKKTQPSIFPDVPTSTSPAVAPIAPSDNLPTTMTQETGMSSGKMLAIAGGAGILALVLLGKKGR